MIFGFLLVPFIEIIIIWIILNYLLNFFWGTRAMDVVIGFLIFLCFFFMADWFNLPVIKQLMLYVVNVATVAVFIIFQPEIRLALSRLIFKGRKYKEISDMDKFIESLSSSVFLFSERQIGALIVLENMDSLDEFVSSSISINAQFSTELLESIFLPLSPLHDGAVIIRGSQIVSAGAILPLVIDSSQLSRSMGTRHRAALGASQKSDALVIIVSEETGKISIARDGILTRGIKLDRFKAILKSILATNKTSLRSVRAKYSKN